MPRGAKKGSKKPMDDDCDDDEMEGHGWENHNGGNPPFEGAAPPIHLHEKYPYPRSKKK